MLVRYRVALHGTTIDTSISPRALLWGRRLMEKARGRGTIVLAKVFCCS
jgi:hypothetical protein